jgi:hypothetical protein
MELPYLGATSGASAVGRVGSVGDGGGGDETGRVVGPEQKAKETSKQKGRSREQLIASAFVAAALHSADINLQFA